MEKECPYCGAKMSEMDPFCTKCGLGTQAYLPEEKQARSRKKKGFRWWMIPLIIVLLGAVIVIVMWSWFRLYFTPELQLVEALSNTGADFTARFKGSPLELIGQVSEWEEGFTSTISLDLSVVGYEGFGAAVSSAWDPDNGSYMISSSQKLFGKTSAKAVYSGQKQVVFAVESSGSADAYAVPFDSLPQGLESEAFSGMSQEEKDDFSAYLDALRLESGGFDRTSLNEGYIQVLIDILKESERSVGYEECMLEGRTRKCGVIAYSLNNYVLAQGLEDLADIAQEDGLMYSNYFSRQAVASLDFFSREEEEEQTLDAKLRSAAAALRQYRDGGITVTFHLFEEKVVRFCVLRQSQGQTDFCLDAELGLDTSTGDILVTLEKEGEKKNYLLRTQSDSLTYSDTLTISGQGSAETIAWLWDRESGSLSLTLPLEGETMQIAGGLYSTETGFVLELPDVLDLLSPKGLTGLDFVQAIAELDLSITVDRGADIVIPEGKALTDWSVSDVKVIQKSFLK